MHVIYHLNPSAPAESVTEIIEQWRGEEARRRPSASIPQLSYQRFEIRRGSGREIIETIRTAPADTTIVIPAFKQIELWVSGIMDALVLRSFHSVRVQVLKPFIELDPRSEETITWLSLLKRARTLKSVDAQAQKQEANVIDLRHGRRIPKEIEEKCLDAFYKQSKSVLDIAKAFKVSASSVKRMIHRHKNKLDSRRIYREERKLDKGGRPWELGRDELLSAPIKENSSLYEAISIYVNMQRTERSAKIQFDSIRKFFKWYLESRVATLEHAGDVRFVDVKEYADKLERVYAESTASLHLINMRSFFKFCVQNHYSDDNPFNQLKLKSVKKDQVTADPIIKDEIGNLLDFIETDTKKAEGSVSFAQKFRNEVAIKILLSSGMRASSLLGIKVGHIDFNPSTVGIRIKIKGGRQAKVVMNQDIKALLQTYISKAWEGETPDPEDYLIFHHVDVKRTPLHYEILRRTLYAVGMSAGITDKLTSHRFRSTFATYYYLDGFDYQEIKTRLNLTNVNQVSQYVKPRIGPNAPSYMKRQS